MTGRSFLRIPPFPGSRPAGGPASWSRAPDADDLALLAAARVGGSFWGPRPAIPPGALVLAPDDAAQDAAMRTGSDTRPVWVLGVDGPRDSDPWHLVESADEVWAGAASDLALVAQLAGRPCRLFGEAKRKPDEALAASGFTDPFTGDPLDPADAIALLAQWRALIDANRSICAVFGVARWKRVTVDPLLWDGTGPVRHSRATRDAMLAGSDAAIAWRSRTPAALLSALEASGIDPGEIEDGMIRSVGLGANCVPPLSVIVDRTGIYFDPSAPSDLDTLLADADIPPVLQARAAALRERLIAAGISKYAVAADRSEAPSGERKRVLVTGQVEDDRSILTGGAGMTNLALLRAARAAEPDAEIVYKPHPDVEAGHRKGAIPDAEALLYADRIEREASITALIDWAQALHVITSLAGFEALMRGKSVTCHGVPFYAGWGLTTDLAPIPMRRSRHRSLDELVAATLILYPRYCDPVTRLPCPPEVLVERLAAGTAKVFSPLIVLRELQGRMNRLVQRTGQITMGASGR